MAISTADTLERVIENAKKNALKNRPNVTADTAERLINTAVAKAKSAYGVGPAPKGAKAPASGGTGGKKQGGGKKGGTPSLPAPMPELPIADYTNYYPDDVPSAAEQWTLENDPVYRQAIEMGQSAFNMARANALAEKQNIETEAAGELRDIGREASSSRERLAGNYAARGMAGGAYGALTRAEAEMNAQQIAAQTSIQDQIAALNQQYLANYGATGTDWTGTLVGQQYRNEAIQQAMQALLPRYTEVM